MEGENESDYVSRVYPQINITSIAERFNYECFDSITNERIDIQKAILIACNADDLSGQVFEGFGQNLFTDEALNPNAFELVHSILLGNFFNKISSKLTYIPIAEFNAFPEEDPLEGKVLARLGIIKFFKPKKYVVIDFYHGFDGLADYAGCGVFKNLKNKINNKLVTELFYDYFKKEMYCPERIYLFDNFKWNLKIIKNILSKQDNLYKITTKIWKISKSLKDPHAKEYDLGSGIVKTKPVFTIKVKNSSQMD